MKIHDITSQCSQTVLSRSFGFPFNLRHTALNMPASPTTQASYQEPNKPNELQLASRSAPCRRRSIPLQG